MAVSGIQRREQRAGEQNVFGRTGEPGGRKRNHHRRGHVRQARRARQRYVYNIPSEVALNGVLTQGVGGKPFLIIIDNFAF